MHKTDTTTTPDTSTVTRRTRVTAGACSRFIDPEVLPQMDRSKFETLLWGLFGNPLDENWRKSIKEELKDDPDFLLFEWFETPTGKIMAGHVIEYPHPVIVVLDGTTAQHLKATQRLAVF